MKHLLIAAAFISASLYAQQKVPKPSLSFRGLQAGMTFLNFHDMYSSRLDAAARKNGHSFADSIGEGVLDCGDMSRRAMTCTDFRNRFQAHVVDSRLAFAYWSIPNSDFESIRDGLSAKYGEPSRMEEQNLQNRMGAHFHGHTFTWQSGTARIDIKEYAGDLEHSSITLWDPALLSKFQQLRPKPTPDI